MDGQFPLEISKRAINAASLSGEDVIIFDTAGRTQIDQQMMMELKQLENDIQPTRNYTSGRLFNRSRCSQYCFRV